MFEINRAIAICNVFTNILRPGELAAQPDIIDFQWWGDEEAAEFGMDYSKLEQLPYENLLAYANDMAMRVHELTEELE